MRSRWSNHSPRTHILPICLFTFSKFHSDSQISSILKSEGQFGGVSYVWFIKVVCTLYVRRNSSVKEVRILNYLSNNLDSSNASSVIKHINSNWKDRKLAFSFLEYTKNMMGIVHSIDTYSFLLRSYSQVGAHDLAKLVIDEMRIGGVLPDGQLLDFVITSFVNAGKFEVAKELIIDVSRSRDGVLSCIVVNKFLSSLMKSKKVDEAVAFFENIILRSQNFRHNSYTFNIVISGLCKASEVGRAFGFFNHMREFGCCPDVVTYNTLLNGFCFAGNVDKAHELLTETCFLDECSLDVKSFTSVISGYCKLGNMEEAMVLFDSMINSGIKPTTITFNVIIDGFGKIGNMVSALNMYEKMVDFGCISDVITFTSILDGYCRMGELHQGLKIWDEMNRRNLSPNLYTFSILINFLCKVNRLNEARDLLRQLKKRDDITPKAFVYNPVIDGFCKAGNVDEANVIVEEMEEKRCKLDKLTFTILIIGHCMKGRMIEAISLFKKMTEAGCSPDSVTVNSLASLLLKAGMPEDAFEIRKVASHTNISVGV